MATEKQRMDPREGAKAVAELAEEALAGFKKDAKDAYAELVKQYDGASASIGVLGMGSVLVSVAGGNVKINAGEQSKEKTRGVGAITPEALVAISEGKMTVLDAYHRGEVVVRSQSDTLHEAYDSFVRHSETALKSKQLQKTLVSFRKLADV